MRTSTVLFAALALVLASATAVTLWRVTNYQLELPRDVGETASYLGLPVIEGDQDRTFPAKSALVWDLERDVILFEENGFDRLPIASLTKLMTAMVALDYGFDWDQLVTIELLEYVDGGKLLLHPGEEVTMRDLFNAALVGSANNATLALVRTLGVPEEEFVQAMNRKAIELGLEQTHFTEVTGLLPTNVSTAYEAARLAGHAFTAYPDIAQATSQAEYVFTVAATDREHTIRNTNQALRDGQVQLTGSKTGYLYEAGYCLVIKGSGKYVNRVAIILGHESEQRHFYDLQRLLALPVS
ncbi:D-alanyl-D-alanine carboxypeptidase [Patescibacteria group bacterium]|nr:D-alanyl-D-alanine carboxypeptidase [Patescibacteria group bacterium]